MAQNFDAVVIGGGVMGGWISLELARQGVEKILLLEKSFPGAGSSGKSSAILRPAGGDAVSIEISRYSLEQYANFQDELGLDIGFRRVGMLSLADTSREDDLRASVSLQREHDIDASVIGPDELRELEPEGVFTVDDRAAWEPEVGHVHPIRTVESCLEVGVRYGVDVRVGISVRSIDIEGGGVTGIRLGDGTKIGSTTVINAAGPWAKGLMNGFAGDLPLKSIRSEQAYLDPPPCARGRRTIINDSATGLTWKPEDAGWTRVGGLDLDGAPEVDPDHCDEGVSGAFIGRCRRGIAERIPAFRNAPSWGGCGALHTVTPDARPIIGPLPGIEGLILVSGFSGRGFAWAPAVALGVAGGVTGGNRGPFVPDLYSLDRLDGFGAPGLPSTTGSPR